MSQKEFSYFSFNFPNQMFAWSLLFWAQMVLALLVAARCHFRDQKSLDFQGPPHPMAIVITFEFARIKIITSRAI
jgi:hypothetical protein